MQEQFAGIAATGASARASEGVRAANPRSSAAMAAVSTAGALARRAAIEASSVPAPLISASIPAVVIAVSPSRMARK